MHFEKQAEDKQSYLNSVQCVQLDFICRIFSTGLQKIIDHPNTEKINDYYLYIGGPKYEGGTLQKLEVLFKVTEKNSKGYLIVNFEFKSGGE